MLKKIDRYIMGKFMVTFFVIIGMIILLASVFDFSEKLDAFVGKGEQGPSLRAILLEYYLNFALFFANMFAPFFAFIAVIFFTSRMAARLEIISILGSGASYSRLLRPFIVTACFIALLNWLSANFVIPKANEVKMNFEQKYFGRMNFSMMNVHRQYSDSEFVYVKSFNFQIKSGGAFAYEKFVDGQLKTKIMSHTVLYDTINNRWKLMDYLIRDLNGVKEKMRSGSQMDTIFPFTPEIFRHETKKIITMSNEELDDFIEQEKLHGSKYLNIYMLEKHQRHANPFTIIVMTLLAVPIASRKVRGGIGIHLAIGVTLAFTYIYLSKVFTASASTGGIDPFWALWIPNLLFFATSLGLIKYAQK